MYRNLLAQNEVRELYCDFTKEELEQLAYGFGGFVQEFVVDESDPSHALLRKLHKLSDEAEKSDQPDIREQS